MSLTHIYGLLRIVVSILKWEKRDFSKILKVFNLNLFQNEAVELYLPKKYLIILFNNQDDHFRG